MERQEKSALSLVPPENLLLYTDHHLGKLVHAVLKEKLKARKRAKKQYNEIVKNPCLLSEKKQNDFWQKRVHRVYHEVLKRWKKKESHETRIFQGAKTLRN